MRDAYLRELYGLAQANPQVLALVADNGAIVYDRFRQDFPRQFINFGISEANMVSVAAGLAACGKIPFAYTIGCFLTMRAFEQVRNDVCLQRMNVKLVGIGAGFVYSNLGPTHHTTEDFALMRALPGMTIFSPADPLEAMKVTTAAARIEGPVYIRLGTGGTPALYQEDYDFQVGRGVVIRQGSDVTVFSTGQMLQEVVKAADMAQRNGRGVRVINIHTIKPIDREVIIRAAQETKGILTVEEHSITGGLGSAVAEILQESNRGQILFKRMGLENVFAEGYGSYADMKAMNGLSADAIFKQLNQLLET